MISDRVSVTDKASQLIATTGLAAAQWELTLFPADSVGSAGVWPSRELSSFSAWLCRSWETARTGGSNEHQACLLSANQSGRLWQRVIEASADGESLLSARGMAGLAREARGSLYHAGLAPSGQRGSEWAGDSAAFLRWNQAFDRVLEAQGWIDAESLLFEFNRRPYRSSDRPVVLLDPPSQSPETARLEERWEMLEIAVEKQSSVGERTAEQRWLIAEDPAAELELAADWAERQLDRQPNLRLAIMVPDLDVRHDEVESAFCDRLGNARVWRQSARSIADIGSFGAAASALSILLPGSGFGAVSRWLRSPFFECDGEDDSARRQGLERWLRGDPRSRQDFLDAYLRYGLADEFRRRAPGPTARLDRALQQLPRHATPTAWVQALQAYLRALGWTGFDAQCPVALSAAWDRAWSEFAELTAILGRLDRAAAIHEFEQVLLRQSAYRPLTLHGVHLLSRVDQIGPGYAGAWIAGFSDLNWPEPAPRNPLVPWAVKADHELPGAKPSQVLQAAREELDRLLRRVPQAVFSCPERILDQPQVPNPRIRHWERAHGPPSLEASNPGSARARIGARAWESVADPAPALTGTRFPGGVRTLDLQSANPAVAFCVARLRSEPLEAPASGIDPRRRGILLHRVLELIANPDASAKPRQEHLSGAIARAFSESMPAGDGVWQTQLAAEKERTALLVERFLELESERAPFLTLATERRLEITIGGWQFQCRIDRIDQLDDGGRLLIDYKSGMSSVAGWFRDRLHDCQLPLYAQQGGDSVTGIAILRLTEDAVEFRAAGTSLQGLPGRHRDFSADDWKHQLDTWRAQIATLIEEFASGDVRISTNMSERGEAAFAALTRIREHVR